MEIISNDEMANIWNKMADIEPEKTLKRMLLNQPRFQPVYLKDTFTALQYIKLLDSCSIKNFLFSDTL